MFVKHKSRPAAKALDIFLSGWYILSVFGEMSERFKEPVLKTGDGATHRGFESHSLRHLLHRNSIGIAVVFLRQRQSVGQALTNALRTITIDKNYIMR